MYSQSTEGRKRSRADAGSVRGSGQQGGNVHNLKAQTAEQHKVQLVVSSATEEESVCVVAVEQSMNNFFISEEGRSSCSHFT